MRHSPSASTPVESIETRRVRPVCRSLTKTSLELLTSSGVRWVAALSNATKRPPAAMRGRSE